MATVRIAVILSLVVSSLLLLSHARVTTELDDSSAVDVAVRDQQPDPAAAGDNDAETLTLETSELPTAIGDGDDSFRYLDFSLRQPFRRHRFIRRPTDRHRFRIGHRFGFGFHRHHLHHHHHHRHHHDGEMMGFPGVGIAGQEIGLPRKSAEWFAVVERKQEEEMKSKKKEHKKKKYETDSDSDSDSDSDELEEKEWRKAKKELKMKWKREREERAKSGAFGWFWTLANRLVD